MASQAIFSIERSIIVRDLRRIAETSLAISREKRDAVIKSLKKKWPNLSREGLRERIDSREIEFSQTRSNAWRATRDARRSPRFYLVPCFSRSIVQMELANGTVRNTARTTRSRLPPAPIRPSAHPPIRRRPPGNPRSQMSARDYARVQQDLSAWSEM